MTAGEVTNQLESIAFEEDFEFRSSELSDAWSSAGAGVETVEPILRFMEEHPTIDYGPPGPLVHFMERFYGKGYDERLIESMQRRPTSHTVWMLNRLINGAKDPAVKQGLITLLSEAKSNPQAEKNVLEEIDGFLDRLSRLPK